MTEHTKPKNAIDQENINPSEKSVLNSTSNADLAAANLSGVDNDITIDDSATFLEAACEAKVAGSSKVNNCYVIMGRDRRNSLGSGYGGLGDTQCGAIDIVVGRHPKAYENNEELFANPDFRNDAARIYISQKTDIDDYCGIKQGPISKSLSGITLKADDVRVVGRRNIKLVTFTDPYDSRGPGKGDIESVGGIHLIAGNQTTQKTDKYILGAVQPMVKGFNLNVLLSKMIDAVFETTVLLDASLNRLIESWEYITQHEHHGFYFEKSTVSPELIKTIPNLQLRMAKQQKQEIADFQMRLKNLKANWGLGTLFLTDTEYEKIKAEGLWPHLSKWNLTN